MSRSPRHSRDLRQLLHHALRQEARGDDGIDEMGHDLRLLCRALIQRTISERHVLPGNPGAARRWVSTLFLIDSLRRRNWGRGDAGQALGELLIRTSTKSDRQSVRRAQALRRLLRRRYPATFSALPTAMAHDPRAWPYLDPSAHPVAVLRVDVVLHGRVLRRGSPGSPFGNGQYLVISEDGSDDPLRILVGAHLMTPPPAGQADSHACENATAKRRLSE